MQMAAPLAACRLPDAILIQAFKQLDHRHCRCIVPLLCSPWQKLSLDSCSSVKARIRRVPSAKQLAAWLKRNASKLDSIEIHILVDLSAAVTGALCDAISNMVALRSLSLIPHYSNNRSLSPILSSLTNLTSLSLHDWHMSEADTAAVVALTKLRSLKLEGISGDHARSSHFVTAIASSLKQLTSLEVSRWRCCSDHLQPLTALSQLQELHLKGTPRDYYSLCQLQGLPLRSVCIELNASGADEVASWIQSCASRLESLSIGHAWAFWGSPAPAHIGELLLRTLSSSASLQLQHFELWGCSTDHEAVAHLQPLTQLKKLVLKHCSLDDLGVRQLAPLSNLQQLQLSNNEAVTGAHDSMKCLANCLPHLTSLMVARNGSAAVLEAFGGRVVKRSYGFEHNRFEIALPGA